MKVVQCWDDGVTTDLRLIEILYKYNAKATFNLCPGTLEDERVESHWAEPGYNGWSHKGFFGGHVGKKELYDVYKDFQVASHCWTHECAGRVPDDVFIKAAVDARKYLEDLFGRECRGFAWPCSCNTPETCDLLRENGFRYRGNITISSEPGHDPERQCFEKILKKTGLEMDSKYLKPVRENGKPMKEEEES